MNDDVTEQAQDGFRPPPAWPFFVADGVIVVLVAVLVRLSEPGERPVGLAAGLLLVGAVVFLLPYLLRWYVQIERARMERAVELRRQEEVRAAAGVRFDVSVQRLEEVVEALRTVVEPREANVPASEPALPVDAHRSPEEENLPGETAPADVLREEPPIVEEAAPAPPVPEEPAPKPRAKKAAARKKPRIKEDEIDALFSTTTVFAKAYIGAGNKLFLRGDGPGLSWEKGVPMQFLEIGRWGWTTSDATGPVTIKMFKNDVEEDPAGEYVVEPGNSLEIEPVF